MISLIFIYKEDLFNIKIEIYYQTMGVIIKSRCSNRYSLDKFPDLRFKNRPNIIVLESIAVEDLLIICVNRNI